MCPVGVREAGPREQPQNGFPARSPSALSAAPSAWASGRKPGHAGWPPADLQLGLTGLLGAGGAPVPKAAPAGARFPGPQDGRSTLGTPPSMLWEVTFPLCGSHFLPL